MTLSPQEEGAPLRPLALTVIDAAKAAAVTRGRLFQAIKAGELCGRKAGKQLVIELTELDRWLKTLPYRGRKPDVGTPEPAVVQRRGGRKRQTPPAPAEATT